MNFSVPCPKYFIMSTQNLKSLFEKQNERLLQKTIDNIIVVIGGKKIITKAKSGLSLKH